MAKTILKKKQGAARDRSNADNVLGGGLSLPAVQAMKEPFSRPTVSPALQTAFSKPIIQRFRLLDKDDYKLEADDKKDARAPFTRFEEKLSLTDEGEGKAMGLGWKKHLDVLPKLNVANDNSLAVNATAGEPKEFYSSAGALSKSASDLAAVNSPIELKEAGNKIKIPGKDEKEAELVMIQPQVKGKEAPGKDDFAALAFNICRDVAKEIIGGGISHAIIKNKGKDTKVSVNTGDSTIVSGTHKLAESLSKGDVTGEEAAKDLGTTGESPKVGKEYGKESRKDEMSAREEEIGVNKSAKPQIGQAYLTQSIFDDVGSKKDYANKDEETNAFVWGYHFGAVVAQSEDGSDQVTMENYNRDSDVKNGRKELLNALKIKFAEEIKGLKLDEIADEPTQIGMISEFVNNHLNASNAEAKQSFTEMWKRINGNINSHWYFRIVGEGAGQSFHEQMAASKFFVNPLTLAVTNLMPDFQKVTFNEGGAELSDVGNNQLKGIAEKIKSTVHQGMAPAKLNITGYASGWKGTGIGAVDKGNARAKAVKDKLIEKGVPKELLEQKESPGRKDKTNKANNRVVEIVAEK